MMGRTQGRRVVVLVALLATTACQSPGAPRAPTPAAARHLVHSARIAAIMRDLDRFTWDRLPQEMDITVERNRRLDELVAAAEALSDAAGSIPDAMDGIELSAAHRTAFVSLADALREQALQLQTSAAARDIRQTEIVLREIDTSCDACHALFRQPLPSR
jgi:cytochrome c556